MEPVDCGMPYPQLSRHRQLANSFGNEFANALNRFLEFRKRWQSAQQFFFASTRMPVLQQRIETVADDSDLEEVYNTERQLLYVACIRARDQ